MLGSTLLVSFSLHYFAFSKEKKATHEETLDKNEKDPLTINPIYSLLYGTTNYFTTCSSKASIILTNWLAILTFNALFLDVLASKLNENTIILAVCALGAAIVLNFITFYLLMIITKASLVEEFNSRHYQRELI